MTNDASTPGPVGEKYRAESVSVVGGGRMGTGIAHAFLMSGFNVRLFDVSSDFAGAARERVVSMVEASERRQLLKEPVADVLARLKTHTSLAAVAGSRLVVEAVPEDIGLKSQVLASVDAVLDEAALLATNTSSISIDELSQFTRRPHRLLGLHFFNPVPASVLVEVVRGDATSDGAVSEAREWVARLGKTPIVVRDSPGFASSRLGLALGLESIRMVEEGVASPEDIDAAMTLGYKHPVGPLRLTDIVGLDVRLGIARYLESRLGARFEPPRLLEEMVEGGLLGQKSGQGFYNW